MRTTVLHRKEYAMEARFSVSMTVKDMYRFLLRHAYLSRSGIISLLISLGALVMFIVRFDSLDPFYRMCLLFAAALFTIIFPIQLSFQATKAVKLNPVFQRPLEYIINDEGITVCQGEETVLLPWSGVFRTVETKTQIVIYSSVKNAFIFPKDQLKEQADIVKKLIESKKDIAYDPFTIVNTTGDTGENMQEAEPEDIDDGEE